MNCLRRIPLSILSIAAVVTPAVAQNSTPPTAIDTVLTDDRMAQMRLYADPTIPIVPELVPAVADWIKSLQ
jgi:hypothetical protein